MPTALPTDSMIAKHLPLADLLSGCADISSLTRNLLAAPFSVGVDDIDSLVRAEVAHNELTNRPNGHAVMWTVFFGTIIHRLRESGLSRAADVVSSCIVPTQECDETEDGFAQYKTHILSALGQLVEVRKVIEMLQAVQQDWFGLQDAFLTVPQAKSVIEISARGPVSLHELSQHLMGNMLNGVGWLRHVLIDNSKSGYPVRAPQSNKGQYEYAGDVNAEPWWIRDPCRYASG